MPTLVVSGAIMPKGAKRNDVSFGIKKENAHTEKKDPGGAGGGSKGRGKEKRRKGTRKRIPDAPQSVLIVECLCGGGK